ncbi:hypothetical protein ONZ51_g778 [Trametes cubensis]|uniref:Uncharacterized protein n=1 Tax=Trametes cubensis TaxID=1111947 RepID=A0AAD7U2R2_9APHY|nr:hypothetical protein ONZ51_g778 [Trametes cubensis]
MQVPQPSPDQTSSSPAREGSISHAVPPADNANANAQRCCTHTMPCGCNGFNMAPVLTFLPLLSYVPMNGSFGMGHPHFPYNMFNPYMGPACQTVHQPAAPGPTTAGGNADSAAPTSPEPSPTASKSPSTTSTTSPCGRRERKDSMRSNSSVTWMLDRAAPSTRHQKLPAGAGKCKGPKLEWKRVRVGEAHPRLRGLVLHFLKNGEPRWVRPASLKKYAKDNEKKKAIVVDDTAE